MQAITPPLAASHLPVPIMCTYYVYLMCVNSGGPSMSSKVGSNARIDSIMYSMMYSIMRCILPLPSHMSDFVQLCIDYILYQCM